MERRGAHRVIRSTETLSTPRGGTRAKTGVEGIANRACSQPEATFTTLMHHLSVENLRACFEVLDGKKVLGVDGVTKEMYGQNLEAKLQELHRQLQQMSYRPQPVRQVEIPKEDGNMRSLGISCTEDKIVQEMTRRILDAIYEPRFIETSYGFRPKRSCHDALNSPDELATQRISALDLNVCPPIFQARVEISNRAAGGCDSCSWETNGQCSFTSDGVAA